ncbi:hypothetical protein [Anaerotignum propionicum]|nr:hypothetical protein [Anaerotignum propionicum]
MLDKKVVEGLCIRAELDLWRGRRSIYGARKIALKSEYVLKQDVVDRMERSVLKHFFLFRGNFEEKLEKEKWEAYEAKKAYEKVELYIEEEKKRIPELERQLEDGMCFNMVHSGSCVLINEVDTTEKCLIVWCELVEEAISISDRVTSFLTDLLVCIERSNNAKAQGSEINSIQIGVCEIVEKANSFFKRLRQEYEKLENWNNIKQINTKPMVLVDERNSKETIHINSKIYAIQNGMENIKENALLYIIQDEMENLQKILMETFSAMEEDGERHSQKLKRERRAEGNLGYEMDKTEAEKSEKVHALYPHIKINIEHSAAVKWEFCDEENLEQEREGLLDELGLLNAELKSTHDEMQKIFNRSRSRFLGKYKKDFDEEVQVPVEIKKLEEKIVVWRKRLKAFRRRAGNFPCALDGYIPMENQRMNRCFENEKAIIEQGWYFTYVDELEEMLKITEKQLSDFCIDV